MTDEKLKEARRAYKRKWAQEHPDKVRKHQETFFAKKAAELEAQQRKTAEA